MSNLSVEGRVLPPCKSDVRGGRQEVVNVATGLAAVNTSLWSMTTVPEGGVLVTFEAITNGCYLRFRGEGGAAGTTANNGMYLPASQQRTYYLDPDVITHVDHLATVGAGVLKWYVSSLPVYAGKKAYGS